MREGLSPGGYLLTGPGSYTHLLAQALRHCKSLYAVAHYYPEWSLEKRDGARRSVWGYSGLIWGLWALWRRLPFIGSYETPRLWQYALYDALCARHFPPEATFLWAWSGTSLYTMQKARALGVPVFLEFPASHPRVWNDIAYKAYQLQGLGKGKYALLPKQLVHRMEKELALADKVIVLSSFVRRQMEERGIPPEKIEVLPLGVEADLFRPAAKLQRKPFRFLYVGRVDPLKGVQYLLEAWKRARFPQAELWIVGHVVEEMKPILAKYDGFFWYMGHRPREALPELYQAATALVFPTLLDSFGLVILEAMACGLPVITTTHSAGPDVLGEGCIPPADVEALQAALERIYTHPAPQEEGQTLRKRVEANYTVEHYFARVGAFLAKNVAQNSLSPRTT